MKAKQVKEVKQAESLKMTLQLGPETVAVVDAIAKTVGMHFEGMPFTRTAAVQAAIGKGLKALLVDWKIEMKVPGSVLE